MKLTKNTMIAIEPTVGIPAVNISQLSKATIFADEENGIYRATIKAYNAQDEFVRNYEAFLTQEEYDAWGTDEDYIYNLICTKLEFIRV